MCYTMFLYPAANMLNFCQAPPEVICCVQCECERLAYSLCGLGALLRVASMATAPAGSSERAGAPTYPTENKIPGLSG